MTKNIFRLLAAASIILAAAACKDERNNFMVDDTLGFSLTDSYAGMSLLDEEYDLPIIKSGKGFSAVTAVLTVSELALAEYNATHGTDYVAIPENLYSISSNTVQFSKDDIRKLVKITWKDTDIADLGDDKDYVIPLYLSSSSSSVNLDEKRSIAIINPQWVYVRMESQTAPISPSASREAVVYDGNISLNNSLKKIDVTVNYAIDYDRIDEYNAANGTDYIAPPEGLVSLDAKTTTIPAGKQSAAIKCRLNSEQLFEGNVLKEVHDKEYLIPIGITSLSSDALGIIDTVMYIPLTMNKVVKGPWTILEGADNCYAKDPNRAADAWIDVYTADKLFDGKWEVGMGNEWISVWDTDNVFPMTFVVDLGETRVFNKFRIGDYTGYQGAVRDYEIYTAETYSGETTQWNLVADGQRGYDWTGVVTFYDYPPANGTLNPVAGRYLKFVIVKHAREKADWTGDYIHGRSKLAEVYGMGF